MIIQEYEKISQFPCHCYLIKVYLNNIIIGQSTHNQYVVNIPVSNVDSTVNVFGYCIFLSTENIACNSSGAIISLMRLGCCLRYCSGLTPPVIDESVLRNSTLCRWTSLQTGILYNMLCVKRGWAHPLLQHLGILISEGAEDCYQFFYTFHLLCNESYDQSLILLTFWLTFQKKQNFLSRKHTLTCEKFN